MKNILIVLAVLLGAFSASGQEFEFKAKNLKSLIRKIDAEVFNNEYYAKFTQSQRKYYMSDDELREISRSDTVYVVLDQFLGSLNRHEYFFSGKPPFAGKHLKEDDDQIRLLNAALKKQYYISSKQELGDDSWCFHHIYIYKIYRIAKKKYKVIVEEYVCRCEVENEVPNIQLRAKEAFLFKIEKK